MRKSLEKVYVAGHNGMVGSSLVRMLKKDSNINIITKTRSQLDLTDQQKVRDFFCEEKPNQVYLAAAKVGGIFANNEYPAEFIYHGQCVLWFLCICSSFERGLLSCCLGNFCRYDF